MDVFSLFGIAVVTSLLAVTVKQYKPEIAMQVSIAGGAMILLMAVSSLTGSLNAIKAMFDESGVDGQWPEMVLKILGIAYITQISAELCRDAGEGALAYKTELCGRALILACAAPAILALMRILLELTEKIG